MRVVIAGGTGVVGRQLLPLLREVGYEAVVLSRSGDAQVAGARVVVADALDRVAVKSALLDLAPDAVVNLLTAIPRQLNPRRIARQMAPTNRLRIEATANLVAAAPGVRLVSEGLAYAYEPVGGVLADENRPLWTEGPKPFRPVVRALGELERLTTESGGTVLRFGHHYGPGTAFAADGAFVEQVGAGRAPIVGNGDGQFSFLHTHDAATAIVAVLDKPVAGVLNVVDDEPSYVRDWLPGLARIIGAPQPKRVPVWLARLAAGAWGVAYMNRIVGADNSLARLSLDWRPRFTTWQIGFDSELRAVRDVKSVR